MEGRGYTAFNTLKTAMTQVPILATPYFTQTFEVETDASGFGLGAGYLIDFFSKTFGTRASLK